jgi:toxin HigB-1
MVDDRFRNRLAYDLFCGRRTKGFAPVVVERAQNKLKLVYAAAALKDLALIPGNRLEPLRGRRSGTYSIRINQQWRICFTWSHGQAEDIEVTDYH